MPKRVLIIGSSGYIGSRTVELLSERGFDVYGVDVRKPGSELPYADFMQGSVSDRAVMEQAFNMAKPDVAVNLAFVVDVTHDVKREEEVALGGGRIFLEMCEKFDVPRVIYVTSVASYGAHDDNDLPLHEISPLRGVKGYSYSRLKELADKMVQEFMVGHVDAQTVILRPCLVVGPHTDNHFFDILKWPIVPQVWDAKGFRNPPFQFIHEDDMAGCLVAAVEKSVSGIFNVAAKDTLLFSELVRRAGKKKLPIPSFLLYPSAFFLWHLRITASPPAQLNFIRYPWIMDASKMENELYVPKKSSEEAFEEFIDSH